MDEASQCSSWLIGSIALPPSRFCTTGMLGQGRRWRLDRRRLHAEDEIFHILDGTVTFSIDGDVFNASVGSIVVIPAGAPDPHVDLQVE
jgi:gentisate 1,2-dioxygenase